MFAEVAVAAAAPTRQTFTYRIPEGLAVEVGHAVYVPFGARTLQGVVMEVTETPAYAEARDIEAVIDERPFVSHERLALASWLSDYYLAPIFDCVSLMLPSGFKQKPLTLLRVSFWADGETPDLSDAERAIVAAVAKRGAIEADELKREVAAPGAARAIAALIRRGVLARP